MKRKAPVDAAELRRRLDAMQLLGLSESACAECGTSVLDAFRGSHKPRLSKARSMVWGILRHFGGMSYPEIGKATGYDHTTVLVQVRTHCPEWREPSPRQATAAEAPVTWRAADGDPVGLGALEGML